MNRLSHASSTIAALALASSSLFLVACAKGGDAPPAKAPPSPPPAQASGVANMQPDESAAKRPSAPDVGDDDDGAAAQLVVARDVVRACPNLRALAGATRDAAPDDFWILVLDGVSECMNAGGLQAGRIAVVGEPSRRDVVRLVLAAKGAPMDRVVAGTRGARRICDASGCHPAPARVEIRLVR